MFGPKRGQPKTRFVTKICFYLKGHMTGNVPENVVMVCEKTMTTLLLEYMVAQEEIIIEAFEKFESVVQQFEKQNAEKSSTNSKAA